MNSIPPLPASVRKKLRGFTSEQVEDAKNTLASFARTCPDPKIRKDAAQYITETARAETYVQIGDLRGKTIEEAADAIFASVADGGCSIEQGDALMEVLRKKADIGSNAELERRADEMAEILKSKNQGPRTYTPVTSPQINGQDSPHTSDLRSSASDEHHE